MRKQFVKPLFEMGDGVRFKNCPLLHGEITFIANDNGGWVYEVRYRYDGQWWLGVYAEDELMI